MSFEQIMEAVVKIWESIQLLLAGLIGAIIVTPYHKDQLKTRSDYMVFIFSGAVMSHYLTYLAIYILARFGWELEPTGAGSVGFLLGALGGMFFQQLICYIKSGAWKEMSLRQFFVEGFKNWLNRKNEK